jgi:spoIIIJ-associated protein
MEELEITAKTIEEATVEAEEKLGLNRELLVIEIVKKGRKGIFKEQAVIRAKPLENTEKDVAELSLNIVEELLNLLGVSAVVNISLDGEAVTVDIEGEDLGILIGRGGRTLASLKYIIRAMVAKQLDTWIPLNVDVCGYQKKRQEHLEGLALRMAEQVKLRHSTMTLEPMPADERRLIHLALVDYPDITTYSIGEGKNRKVAISITQR